MDNQIEIIQVDGQAVFTSDEQGNKYVQFLPDDPVEQFVEGWRHEGVAQRLRNGTFDLSHGRAFALRRRLSRR
jgi:hypothetical protein